ncbi:RNA pseudouridine synthase 3, mitochondrial isoform X2, partial [Tanacetum coccineum]
YRREDSNKSSTTKKWLFEMTQVCRLQAWHGACETTHKKYWALVIGTPKEKEGLIFAPLGKVLLNGGKDERVMLAYGYGLEASRERVTKYRVHGPTISGCSWLELRPHTNHKHQVCTISASS